ncbi:MULTISPECIES: lipid IV(A) 3-deoxy-D-manno-octulosonic acid transferase [Rhizobium]|uniref:3-deoxy-D-manno-octulosonic acid transferase n=1 Tax=Rhizobium rhododendri TaxID=2506430 RepID=A0ABY8II13_9HYPH|nr:MULTISPECIES: lipid IV(A) 3-deoxy-D-manno-octulosonic acid transferase [Rhizobium]MBO9097411.1 lipid IV(A) 3-deoxy-D-manno-octulosonic acid transferase [Rhizobium sp. L58/93]MBO9167650.1 lipid IV(A) 3-deoxy-D-manno-octulosonic acid transferase [Rhizobium sp. L245/93]MBO9183609.1 lipid IV(A) 3-deoxy-D-manno-octulosonic acid transferase [Rhizobium sp. E27B/91]MBZ5760517.1 lipid IV(A) 3-deoxy-D-manno-octulosonic acid transferase [Rhizobium sp. VS19-DR96]MBZ5766639.1 lipid IV(A) 3-deoxy-D-manno
MSSFRARMALKAYRLGGVAISPLMTPYLALRATNGKEDKARRGERFGYASANRPQGPLIWFHAASVGETSAVVPLIREIRQRNIHVLLTTGTMTSAQVTRERLGNDVIHQYVPLDLKPAVARFLDYWQPDCSIIAESEIWPTTIGELVARRIPQILVNARMSDKSFSRWQRHPSLAAALLENMALVLAQSDVDAERFRDLGALQVSTSGNLKVDTDAPPYDAAVLADYMRQLGTRKTWAAVSTFEGEENAAAVVHRTLKARDDLLTILVPRHPERCDDIEKMLLAQGLKVARRTRNDPLTADVDVFLGDTIGEMGLYLRMTEVAFVGRSLFENKGGQNPIEPAMMGCAILTGGHVQNFRESYQRLARSGSARMVRDTEMLAKGVHYLLTNDTARATMIEAGFTAVHEMRGALTATIKGLEPYINPLTLKARLLPKAAQA